MKWFNVSQFCVTNYERTPGKVPRKALMSCEDARNAAELLAPPNILNLVVALASPEMQNDDPLLALDAELDRILLQPRPAYERMVTALREEFGSSVDITISSGRMENTLRAELVVNDREGQDKAYIQRVAARAASLDQYCHVSLSWASEWSVQ